MSTRNGIKAEAKGEAAMAAGAMAENAKAKEAAGEPVCRERADSHGGGKALMYLGPTIAGAVRHSTVFKDGILCQKARECIAELPMMERLFVEINNLPYAVRELKEKQSALSAVYEQVMQKFVRR